MFQSFCLIWLIKAGFRGMDGVKIELNFVRLTIQHRSIRFISLPTNLAPSTWPNQLQCFFGQFNLKNKLACLRSTNVLSFLPNKLLAATLTLFSLTMFFHQYYLRYNLFVLKTFRKKSFSNQPKIESSNHRTFCWWHSGYLEILLISYKSRFCYCCSRSPVIIQWSILLIIFKNLFLIQ